MDALPCDYWEVESWATHPGVRRSMRSNRPRDTRTEIAFRRALHATGLRFNKHRRPVEGLRCEPDLLFPGPRLAVFIDGCFWHACPEHRSVRPKTHADWWSQKLDGTVARDRRNDAALEAAGWSVLRIWEHEPTADAVDRVITRIAELRGRTRGP